MFLSQLISKQIIVNNTPRGITQSVAISLKSKSVKHLYCASEAKLDVPSQSDFVLPISAVVSCSENALFLSHLRPIIPKNTTKLFIGMPIYNHTGEFLGELTDAEIQNCRITSIYTKKNGEYPFTSVSAVADVIILKKPQPYPIGQRLPNLDLVTKSLLRKAVEEKRLIQFTLSLPPFSLS